ncbi:hypothetical protein Tsubulata_039809 [Turnera subulata]|uniref:Uncharacterized protein n=1 Tax=Turnera subulata TaxID=218843 RepID=A0A9Q0F4B9_9ROSI|nr:hypothetical protein Tsubulata_039809 [Turnera subulata]
MGRLGLVCLILAGILMLQAMAEEEESHPLEGKARPALSPAGSSADAAASDHDESGREAEPPHNRKIGKNQSFDKSVAGGGVIIGGLATVIFATLFCYIRVTRKKPGDKSDYH